MFKDLLILLAIFILLVEIHQKLRQTWLRHIMAQKKTAKRPRKPAVLGPKSERDCRFCQKDKRKGKSAECELSVAWAMRKGKGVRKKKIATGGYFCPNQVCEYYGIRDEGNHALVGYGRHGTQELIQDFRCQACGKMFTARRNTILYRL